MSYNFSQFKQKTAEISEWLSREFSGIRTGRATPAILDGVMVEAYNSQMPINQVATVTTEGARMIRIAPWDATLTKAVEKAIISSGLGLSATVDGNGLRVIFPELTADRRSALLKIAKQKLEDAKATLRGEREKILKDIDAQEKSGAMSEDEKFRLKAELQKMVDESGQKLTEIFEKKEKEIGE
jgi:ribosome recycling factor